jgi:ATP phosphoribosyltransferase regulatory subunit
VTAFEVKGFAALERQAQVLTATLVQAGYEVVAPALIQPADIFLDVVGEALRARTYVFTDPDGAELCLRPDITIPVARLHLERGGAPSPARYCYNGPAFRYQAAGAGRAHPREFRQAGLELIGAEDEAAADAEVFCLTDRALKAAGLGGSSVRIGDIAIIEGALAALDMPARWRRRLMDRFWRPDAFLAELSRLTTDPGASARRLDRALAAAIDPDDAETSDRAVLAHIQAHGLEIVGARTVRDVAERLMEAVDDRRLPALDLAIGRFIGDLLAIETPALQAVEQIERLVAPLGIDLSAELQRAEIRLDCIRAAGIDGSRITFEADFGRSIEYYSGFVFEVHGPALARTSPVAGGGRYDRVMRVLGATRDVPAVGAAIHTERLLASLEATVIAGGRS